MSTGKTAKRLGVSVKTLQRWEREGRLIPVARTDSNRRLYTETQLRAFIGWRQAPESPSRVVADGRVSSAARKPDLAHQRRVLEAFVVARGLANVECLFSALQGQGWTSDPYLRRIMRQDWARGHNRTHNQIIVRADNYTTFQLGGRAWIKIPGLENGQRIAIPLKTTVEPTGTLRLILTDDDRIEVHYAIDAAPGRPGGARTIGVDKGYSEVLVDSDGAHHGQELGALLTDASDRLKAKYQRRSQLRALANRTRNPRKREHIRRFNLGRKKLDRQLDQTQARIRDTVFQAVHTVVDKAAVIAAEDLTAPVSGTSFGKNVNRRLSAWTKGVIAEALESVSRRRGSTVVLVNPAYTSQIDSRHGDRFHCFDGVVLQADQNAARNVLARLTDPDIERFTPYRTVKTILQARTERLRLGLLNPDSSCSPTRALSTESELPNKHFRV